MIITIAIIIKPLTISCVDRCLRITILSKVTSIPWIKPPTLIKLLIQIIVCYQCQCIKVSIRILILRTIMCNITETTCIIIGRWVNLLSHYRNQLFHIILAMKIDFILWHSIAFDFVCKWKPWKYKTMRLNRLRTILYTRMHFREPQIFHFHLYSYSRVVFITMHHLLSHSIR